MKKYIILVLSTIFIASCTFMATPTTTPTAIPTLTSIPSPTQYAGKWYGERSTEEITSDLWSTEDYPAEAYAITNKDVGRDGLIDIERDTLEFVQKDGKTFLKINDNDSLLYYWPSDLNPAMITSPPPDAIYLIYYYERYLYGAGYSFFSIRMVSINE